MTEACRGALASACTGPLIDAAHPVVAEWARERGIDPATLLRTLSYRERAQRRTTSRAGRETLRRALEGVFVMEVAGESIVGTLAELVATGEARGARWVLVRDAMGKGEPGLVDINRIGAKWTDEERDAFWAEWKAHVEEDERLRRSDRPASP